MAGSVVDNVLDNNHQRGSWKLGLVQNVLQNVPGISDPIVEYYLLGPSGLDLTPGCGRLRNLLAISVLLSQKS